MREGRKGEERKRGQRKWRTGKGKGRRKGREKKTGGEEREGIGGDKRRG